MSKEDMNIVLKNPKEINCLSESELDEYITSILSQFFDKFNVVAERIKDSLNDAEKAKNIEFTDDFWANLFTGGNYARDKKQSITLDSVIKNNQALSEINDLLQAIIGLIGLNHRFNQKMLEGFSNMIEVGFMGRDGQFHELTEDSKLIARKVLEEASRYAQNQMEIELRFECLNKEIEFLKNENTKQNIEIANFHNMLKEKGQIDAEQTEEIKKIKKSVGKKYCIVAIILSSFALVCGFASVILHYIK